MNRKWEGDPPVFRDEGRRQPGPTSITEGPPKALRTGHRLRGQRPDLYNNPQ